VPEIIPHKKLLFTLLCLCLSWMTFALPIVITKNGPGICPGSNITLSCSEPNIVTYTWQQLNSGSWGNASAPNSPNFVTGKAGRFRLTATDISGNYLESNDFDIVLLTPPPVPVITPNRAGNQICQGDSMILKTTFQTGYQYFWYFNSNPNALNQLQTVTWVAKKDGTYTLKITDQSPTNGCSSSSQPYILDYTSAITIKIDSVSPICSLSATPINLVATPSGGQFKGKGVPTGTATFNPSVAGVGKHEITYSIDQNGGCPSISDKRTISVSDLKPIITTNTGKTQFCIGDPTVTLSVLPNMKNYAWYQVGNPTPVGSLSKLDIGLGGKFNVAVLEKETLCQATSPDVNIEFFAASSVAVDPIPSVCGLEFTAVPLKGTPSGGAFTIDGAFATTFDYKKLGFGKHTVLYTLNGSLPCLQGSATQDVLIQDFPKPDLGPDILLGKGNSVTLKGAVEGGVSYAWTPATDLDNPTAANPVASPIKTQEYILKVLSSNGCPGEGKVNIVVYQPVYIPTAFSPNADGMNDIWELSGLEVYPNPEVQIFNRWGNMIFYSKGSYAPFNGTDSNKALPEGMYVYKINPFPDRPDFQYKGTFMLFR
jgi:gliding motility-associated-like protein